MFEAFITVLVVANVTPILPVILQFTQGLDARSRRRMLLEAVVLGNAVAIGTALLGGLILRATRLQLADLRIAGGLVLVVFATYDLLFNREQRKRPMEELVKDPHHSALVPMAVPVLVGPAVLTTVLVVAEDHGRMVALIAVGANALINAVLLVLAVPIYERVGGGFGRALGKVFSLILAALAISMIRTGLTETILGPGSVQ